MQTEAGFLSWLGPALCCVVCLLIILTRNLLVLFPNWRSVIHGNFDCLQEERGVSYQLTQLPHTLLPVPPPLSHCPRPLPSPLPFSFSITSSCYCSSTFSSCFLPFSSSFLPPLHPSLSAIFPSSLFPSFVPSCSFGPSYLFLLLPFFSLIPPLHFPLTFCWTEQNRHVYLESYTKIVHWLKFPNK